MTIDISFLLFADVQNVGLISSFALVGNGIDVHAQLQLPNPSAIIELFELQTFASIHGVAQTLRFHPGTTQIGSNIVWNGNSYTQYPCIATGFEYNGKGQLPRPRLQFANLQSLVSAMLIAVNEINPGNDLINAKFTRIRTLHKYIDSANYPQFAEIKNLSVVTDVALIGINPNANPNAKMPDEIYYIERKVTETRDIVEFELVAAFDMVGVRAPRRMAIANICQWRYRSVECSYTGSNYYNIKDEPVASLSEDICGKRLTSCKLRFGANNPLPYGSYPGLGGYDG
jgi:lambda family phage minor tail protein L